MTVHLSRRGLFTLGAAAGTSLLLTSCVGGGTPTLPVPAASGTAGPGPRRAVAPDVYDPIILGGPVADAAAIAASPWAQKIKDAGVLRRGGSDTGAIFSLRDPVTGRVTGFDAGIGDLLSHYITGGNDVSKLSELSVTTVDTRETMLQNNTVDVVVATYTITPARAEKIAFAGPYYASGAAVQVRADNTEVTSYNDLQGKRVATESNSTAITAIEENIPNAEIILFADNAACVAAVEQGRADAYVLDESILLSNAISNPNLKVIGPPFTEDPYGVGINRDDATAKAFVNDFLQKIFDSGDWARLYEVTIGEFVEGATPTPPSLRSVPGSE